MSSGSLTGRRNYFEDFSVGDRYRHPRGTTVGEVENQLLTKLVMNTAHAHFNEDAMQSTPFGQRLVFGLVTASIVIGLASVPTAKVGELIANSLSSRTLQRAFAVLLLAVAVQMAIRALRQPDQPTASSSESGA